MAATVTPLHRSRDCAQAAQHALTALTTHLERSTLSPHTIEAYHRQAAAYTAWLCQHQADHPDAFTDTTGAEHAVTAWRRRMLHRRASPSTVNQALAAITLMYQHGPGLTLNPKKVTRVRVAKPGAPDALTRRQEGALRRAAERRGPRDAAIINLLLDTGARVAECARLDLADVPVTARTGQARLHGKGDQVRHVPIPPTTRRHLTTWQTTRRQLLAERPELAARVADALWIGQRGRTTAKGITEVVLACGRDAGIEGLRPHRLRHTYATRLREGGMDPAQIQTLMGHVSITTTARYFRAGQAEVAAEIERILGDGEGNPTPAHNEGALN